ncbi:DNA internalization-related competence protein ComEC/Rec2 [Enterococcus sp. HY326]|uniref:DNA internalization-related competence protein ComEC/Rec2 n=1 Tax=Enterococcus sp. HY326 TaxID=2971265 RepID=UPI00224091D7|nr:DNA internalization-related competence protein ComEC/Rec2 [Enterococcus sp. HY326]
MAKTKLTEEELATNCFIVQIQPDSIKVNGDLVSFTSQDLSTKKNYLTRLVVKSEAEKEHWQYYSQNSTLTVEGELSEADGQCNLGGFNYQDYLKTMGQAGILTIETYQIKGEKDSISLSKIRRQLIVYLQKTFSKKLRSYLEPLILGYRQQSFQELRKVYSGVGLTQLISMSGIHIVMIANLFYWIMRRCHLSIEASIVPIGVLVFSIMILCGAGIPVLRGGIAFLLQRLKQLFNWQLSKLDSFSITLLIVLMLRPLAFLSLSGIISFALSFLLLELNQIEFETFAPLKRNMILQVCLIPIFAISFYQIPILGAFFSVLFFPIFKNILFPSLLFCLPVSLLKDFAVFGLYQDFLEFLLFATESFLKVFSGLSLSLSIISSVMLLFLLMCSLLFIFVIRKGNWQLAITILLILLLPTYKHHFKTDYFFAFVDVGQGDAIYFEAPFLQETILIDTGGRLNFSREGWQERHSQSPSEYNLIPFIQSRGVKTIDKLIITHADEDHMGETRNLLENFSVNELYLANGVQNNGKMHDFLKDFTAQNGRLQLVQAGDVIGDYFKFQILYPSKNVLGENNDSLVLWTKLQERSLLLTGDLEAAGEQELLVNYPNLSADILKVGHHGSKTSTTPEFVNQLETTVAIICCGQDNRFGHPHPEVLATLKDSRVLRTDRDGMIYFSDGNFNLKDIQTVVQQE